MPKHLFIELGKADSGGRTAYDMVEEHLKKAIVLASAVPGGHQSIAQRIEELKVDGGSITDAGNNEVYELPLELVEALSSIRRVTELDGFVLRRKKSSQN